MADAIVAVIRRGDRVLYIRRGPEASRSDHWAPLSGRVEAGERQEDTVVREVREEVGLEVRPLRKVWECLTDDGRYTLHWWTVEVLGGHLLLDPGEVAEARWLTVEEIHALEPTFEGDLEFFDRIFPSL